MSTKSSKLAICAQPWIPAVDLLDRQLQSVSGMDKQLQVISDPAKQCVLQ